MLKMSMGAEQYTCFEVPCSAAKRDIEKNYYVNARGFLQTVLLEKNCKSVFNPHPPVHDIGALLQIAHTYC